VEQAADIGWFEAVILGILQGLTEFLPISSSAHIRIAGELAGWGDPGAAFTAVIQIGTESAVILYFWREIWSIISHWTRSLFRPELRSHPDARKGWFIIVGTLPIGILGYTFQETIETALRSLIYVSIALIGFALILGWADRIAKSTKTLDDMSWRDALLMGCAQAMALIPGVSRSGGTITAGLLLGYTREAAAKYSFLLAIPAVLASAGLELFDIGNGETPEWGPTIIATVVSFVVGFAVVAFLMRWLKTHSFVPFVVYRVLLGTLILILLLTGVISAY
jgi:undecaprenyl-diphosphatase